MTQSTKSSRGRKRIPYEVKILSRKSEINKAEQEKKPGIYPFNLREKIDFNAVADGAEPVDFQEIADHFKVIYGNTLAISFGSTSVVVVGPIRVLHTEGNLFDAIEVFATCDSHIHPFFPMLHQQHKPLTEFTFQISAQEVLSSRTYAGLTPKQQRIVDALEYAKYQARKKMIQKAIALQDSNAIPELLTRLKPKTMTKVFLDGPEEDDNSIPIETGMASLYAVKFLNKHSFYSNLVHEFNAEIASTWLDMALMNIDNPDDSYGDGTLSIEFAKKFVSLSARVISDKTVDHLKQLIFEDAKLKRAVKREQLINQAITQAQEKRLEMLVNELVAQYHAELENQIKQDSNCSKNAQIEHSEQEESATPAARSAQVEKSASQTYAEQDFSSSLTLSDEEISLLEAEALVRLENLEPVQLTQEEIDAIDDHLDLEYAVTDQNILARFVRVCRKTISNIISAQHRILVKQIHAERKERNEPIYDENGNFIFNDDELKRLEVSFTSAADGTSIKSRSRNIDLATKGHDSNTDSITDQVREMVWFSCEHKLPIRIEMFSGSANDFTAGEISFADYYLNDVVIFDAPTSVPFVNNTVTLDRGVTSTKTCFWLIVAEQDFCGMLKVTGGVWLEKANEVIRDYHIKRGGHLISDIFAKHFTMEELQRCGHGRRDVNALKITHTWSKKFTAYELNICDAKGRLKSKSANNELGASASEITIDPNTELSLVVTTNHRNRNDDVYYDLGADIYNVMKYNMGAGCKLTDDEVKDICNAYTLDELLALDRTQATEKYVLEPWQIAQYIKSSGTPNWKDEALREGVTWKRKLEVGVDDDNTESKEQRAERMNISYYRDKPYCYTIDPDKWQTRDSLKNYKVFITNIDTPVIHADAARAYDSRNIIEHFNKDNKKYYGHSVFKSSMLNFVIERISSYISTILHAQICAAISKANQTLSKKATNDITFREVFKILNTLRLLINYRTLSLKVLSSNVPSTKVNAVLSILGVGLIDSHEAADILNIGYNQGRKFRMNGIAKLSTI